MKRKQFVKYLEAKGCTFLRHGSKHDLYKNLANNKVTTVPRHPTIDRNLCNYICKQLEIPVIF